MAAVKIPIAVRKVINPSVLGIIKRCLQDHWEFEGKITRRSLLKMCNKAKEALRQCVTDRVYLEKDVRIILSKEDIAKVRTVGGLEELIELILAKIEREGAQKKIPVTS